MSSPAAATFRQIAAYLFWGAASFAFNIIVFYVLVQIGINYTLANIITLILLKIFVFVTNKLYVFNDKAKDAKEIAKEFVKFLLARFATNLIDIFGLVVFVEYLGFEVMLSKTILAVIVIILNFIASKWYVFK